MKWISFFVAIGLAAFGNFAHAEAPPTFRQPHPLAWMHGLPTGEMPGWSDTWWVNFEADNANVWSAPTTMNDTRNGHQYQYQADYEQANAILEIGHAFWDRLGVSLEIPYSYRSGGFMDQMIDGFHLLIGNRRFHRNFYPKNQTILSVKDNGVEHYVDQDPLRGVANVRLKLKWWLAKWEGLDKGSCPCGLSLSSETKFPTQDEKYGGTTGHIDQSFLLHLGVPLFDSSSMWFTAGYTALGDNPAMHDWPRINHILMYEGDFDIALDDSWGIIFQARAESPFLDRHSLTYYDTSTDPQIISENRAASGWNSLVHWRGSEGFGLRYRASGGNQIQFLMVEDWGVGPYDASDDAYSNNAPDVNFVLQSQLSF